MKKAFHSLVFAFFMSVFCQEGHPGLPGTERIDSRLITGWIGLQLQLIRNTTGVTHVAYSRHFSYTGVALYESLVRGNPEYKTIASRLNGNVALPDLPKGKPVFYPAAANAAMADMLRFFYSAKPGNFACIDSLEKVNFTNFAAGINNKDIDLDGSVKFGRQVAEAVIAWSNQDGAGNANIPYTPLGEGFWEPAPAALAAANLPGWGNNRTMLPGSIEGTIPVATPSFLKDPGTPFHNMAKEVYDVSQSLTQTQKSIALFWDDAPNGTYATVFGHWFSILKQVLEEKKTPLMKGTEAYLRLGVAMNEAAISCWKTKYTYHQVRPVTYIREYMGYIDWRPLISTPPHPEYSAAHATISASAGYALESVLGKNYSFTDHTYDGIGMSPRSFSSFEAAGMEAGMSRLYGGINYRHTIETGNAQGKKVSANVVSLLRTH